MEPIQNPSNQQPLYRDEHLFMDLRQQVVILDSEAVRLTPMQYRLLALLVEHPGEVVPRAALSVQVRARLRNLLADRFNLKARVEKRDFDSAVLVVAPGGLKMTPSGTKGTPAPRGRTSACEFPVLPVGRPGFVSQFGDVHGVTVDCHGTRASPIWPGCCTNTTICL